MALARERGRRVLAIRPRCESGMSEQGCETCGARETRETNERGRVSDYQKGELHGQRTC